MIWYSRKLSYSLWFVTCFFFFFTHTHSFLFIVIDFPFVFLFVCTWSRNLLGFFLGFLAWTCVFLCILQFILLLWCGVCWLLNYGLVWPAAVRQFLTYHSLLLCAWHSQLFAGSAAQLAIAYIYIWVWIYMCVWFTASVRDFGSTPTHTTRGWWCFFGRQGVAFGVLGVFKGLRVS